MTRYLLPVALFAAAAAVARPQPVADPAGPDNAALRKAGLDPADGPGLVGYLKTRTATDADKGKVDAVIRRFAADRFEDRQAASAEAARLGPVAISLLRAVEENKQADPEIRYRAREALKTLTAADHGKVAAAAVRGVARLKPPGAAAALLGFLPLADSPAVAADIRAALPALAVRDGKAEPALVAALADKSAVIRAAVYEALVEGGPAGEKVRVPDAYPAVKAAVRADPDPDAKFRGLWALVRTTREKEFVPDLIAMIPQLPRGRLWQLEDLLLRLAGAHPAGGRFGRGPDALAAARDAWAGWWAKTGADVGKADLTPRVRGQLDIVLQDPNFGRGGTVLTLGPDLKEVWRLPSPDDSPVGATDARLLPAGGVLAAEMLFGRVTERDATGAVVRSYTTLQPSAVDLLPNGNWLVVSRGKVDEVRPGAEVVRSYTRPRPVPPAGGAFVTNMDIAGGKALPGGGAVVVTAGQTPGIVKLDAALAPVGAPVPVGRVLLGGHVGVDVTPAGTVLVCEQTRVAEYDLASGKAVWHYDVGQPSGVQRLANGNTLVTLINLRTVLELSPDREVLWEFRYSDPAAPGNVPARAYRR